MMAVADAEEAAERHVGIGDLAALLVDHHAVDRTELVAGCIVHFGAFDLVGGNQAVRCCRSHGSSPFRFMVAVARDSSRSGYRSEEHTSELQSLMRISYAVFCLKKKKI